MIAVSIVQTGGKINSFTINGHADFAERGEDIVCAGASSIAQTAVLGLNLIAKAKVDIRKFDGSLSVKIDEPNESTEVILGTMILGLKDLAKQYPKHIKVIEEEK